MPPFESGLLGVSSAGDDGDLVFVKTWSGGLAVAEVACQGLYFDSWAVLWAQCRI